MMFAGYPGVILAFGLTMSVRMSAWL